MSFSIRQEEKMVVKKIKGMKDKDTFKAIEGICKKYANGVIDISKEVLHKEFGFGPARQERFIEALKKKLKEEEY